MDKRYNLKIWVKVVIILIIIIFLSIGILNIAYSFKKEKPIIKYSYIINQDLDYNVNLKENDFFDTLTLEKNQVYTSYFIDNIIAMFEYQFSSAKEELVEIEYDITGSLYGQYQKNSIESKLWHKDYQLLSLKKLEKTSPFIIEEQLGIDFNYYNSVAFEFRKKIALPMSSFLRVSFNIFIKVASQEIADKREIIMDIPLLQEAFSITENLKKEETINIFELNKANKIKLKELIIGIMCLILSLIITFYYIKLVKPKRSYYNQRLFKILKNYGNVIIELVNPLDIKKFKVVDVKNFNEILDLEEQLREPIMFHETIKNTKGEFILINNNVLYRYILEDK